MLQLTGEVRSVNDLNTLLQGVPILVAGELVVEQTSYGTFVLFLTFS
jgi:hypothetical protein